MAQPPGSAMADGAASFPMSDVTPSKAEQLGQRGMSDVHHGDDSKDESLELSELSAALQGARENSHRCSHGTKSH